MLYASSRATLISTLGLRAQRLSNQIIATSKSELVFPSSEESTMSLSELSIREKELAEIKAAEAEGAHGTSKRSTNLISSSGVAFPISQDAKDAIASLATAEGEELVQLVGSCGV
jgi:twinfilin